MRSKEDVLKANSASWELHPPVFDGHIHSVYDAMDDYAKEVALDFKKWVGMSGFNDTPMGWVHREYPLEITFSDDDVFELYLKSKNTDQG